MTTTISMTNRWQVHIPDAIRKTLNIDRAIQFNVSVENGAIVLRPRKSSLDKHFGAFKTNKKVDIENLREKVDYSEL
jgi:bifunctional DNA-binding transcriptional regulator/antitoxin component of YhaV-PrlF toxin-antitoxin module